MNQRVADRLWEMFQLRLASLPIANEVPLSYAVPRPWA